MSNYNSENTHVLATHMQAGNNKRMLLFHVFESGRHEYVIGSYFTSVWEPIAGCYDYSWDWGHYFADFLDAAHYWEREVLGIGDGAEEQAAL